MPDPESLTGSRASAEEDPLAGTPYRLLRYVAEGAMGEIAEAEHLALRRKVMVKLIRRVYASAPGFADRLRLEAQSLAALGERTPHVVAVLDVGETREGRPFLVLERLRGRTLKEELRSRAMLPPAEAVQLARELIGALACAHEVGIIHRDVKPENIFLAESGRGGRILKLLDFGLAKVLPGASEEEAPAPLAAPTEQGIPLGTPRFLAPEQARGGTVDHRSDLYSAGAVLYVMLTGRDPFAHVEGIAAILRAQLSEPPRPPSAVASQPIPEALDRIVLKALSKKPEDRFSSAAEMSAALDGALAPRLAVGWGATERMNVTAFHGAGRGRAPVMPEKTEPLDVSIFRGALGRQAPLPWPEARPAPRFGAPPTVLQASAAPALVHGGKAKPWRTAAVVILGVVLVAAVVLLVIIFLTHLR